MTTSNYPKTVTIHGSGGDAEYCAVTGEAVTDPYTNEDFLLAKIDLKEYLEYWLHLDPDGISLEIDVLDIAGWNGLLRVRPARDQGPPQHRGHGPDLRRGGGRRPVESHRPRLRDDPRSVPSLGLR